MAVDIEGARDIVLSSGMRKAARPTKPYNRARSLTVGEDTVIYWVPYEDKAYMIGLVEVDTIKLREAYLIRFRGYFRCLAMAVSTTASRHPRRSIAFGSACLYIV